MTSLMNRNSVVWQTGGPAPRPSSGRLCDALAVLEDAVTIEPDIDPSSARALPGVALSVVPVVALVALLAVVIGGLDGGGETPFSAGTTQIRPVFCTKQGPASVSVCRLPQNDAGQSNCSCSRRSSGVLAPWVQYIKTLQKIIFYQVEKLIQLENSWKKLFHLPKLTENGGVKD